MRSLTPDSRSPSPPPAPRRKKQRYLSPEDRSRSPVERESRDLRRYARDETDSGDNREGDIVLGTKMHNDSIQVHRERLAADRERTSRYQEKNQREDRESSGRGHVSRSERSRKKIARVGGESSTSTSQMDLVMGEGVFGNDSHQAQHVEASVAAHQRPIKLEEDDDEIRNVIHHIPAPEGTQTIDISSGVSKYRKDIIKLSRGYRMSVGHITVNNKKNGEYTMECIKFTKEIEKEKLKDKKDFTYSMPAELVPEIMKGCAIILGKDHLLENEI